jgi:hypothetical protein
MALLVRFLASLVFIVLELTQLGIARSAADAEHEKERADEFSDAFVHVSSLYSKHGHVSRAVQEPFGLVAELDYAEAGLPTHR